MNLNNSVSSTLLIELLINRFVPKPKLITIFNLFFRILTALKVISGNMGGPMGNMGGPMNNMGGPMGNMGGPMGGPMFNRGYGGGGYGGGYNDGPYGGGYGRGYGRGYDDGYGRGNNFGNGPRYAPGSRRPGGDSRLGPKRTTVTRDDPTKKNTPNKRKRKPAGEKKDPTEAEM